MSRPTKSSRIVGICAHIVLWGSLFALAALASNAVADYRAAELERLERVHLQGMVQGASLCVKDRP